MRTETISAPTSQADYTPERWRKLYLQPLKDKRGGLEMGTRDFVRKIEAVKDQDIHLKMGFNDWESYCMAIGASPEWLDYALGVAKAYPEQREKLSIAIRRTQQVLEMRGEGKTQQEIADTLGISQQTASNIAKRCPGEDPVKVARRQRDDRIRELHGDGMSQRAIAKEVGCSDYTVRQTVRGNTNDDCKTTHPPKPRKPAAPRTVLMHDWEPENIAAKLLELPEDTLIAVLTIMDEKLNTKPVETGSATQLKLVL